MIQTLKKGFRDNVPLIATLCNPGIRDRHWKQMSDICGFDITPDPFTTLRKMQKMDLDQHMEQFEAISGGATKEFSLEKALAKMQEEWEPIEVIIVIIIYFLRFIFSSILSNIETEFAFLPEPTKFRPC